MQDTTPSPRARLPLGRMILLGCLAMSALSAIILTSAATSPARSTPRHTRLAMHASTFQFALADYEPATFSDPRVAELGIHHARDVVPWNVATQPGDLPTVTAWLEAAKTANITPLITFQHADNAGRAPSQAQFLSAFLKFRKLFPWVKEFTPWDEATHYTQPTAHHPELAASYYNAMAANCHGCVITAPDTLDSDPGVEGWIHRFLRRAHPYPAIWPFNPYTSVRLDNASRIHELMNSVHGQIWFAEVGGVVWWRLRGKLIYHGVRSAATAAKNIFSLAKVSSRIKRVYYYHWRSPGSPYHLPKSITWDAGLIDSHGQARLALGVVAKELHRHIQSAVPKTF